MECEARHLLSMSLAARRTYLEAPIVAGRVQRLKETILRLHRARQEAA